MPGPSKEDKIKILSTQCAKVRQQGVKAGGAVDHLCSLVEWAVKELRKEQKVTNTKQRANEHLASARNSLTEDMLASGRYLIQQDQSARWQAWGEILDGDAEQPASLVLFMLASGDEPSQDGGEYVRLPWLDQPLHLDAVYNHPQTSGRALGVEPVSKSGTVSEDTTVLDDGGSPKGPLCSKPPQDWECSRKEGHDGPCAATYSPKCKGCGKSRREGLSCEDCALPTKTKVVVEEKAKPQVQIVKSAFGYDLLIDGVLVGIEVTYSTAAQIVRMLDAVSARDRETILKLYTRPAPSGMASDCNSD